MPNLIIPPGFAQIVHKWQMIGQSQEWFSSYGIELATGITDPFAVAGDQRSLWIDNWPVSTYSSGVVYLGCSAYLGSDSGDTVPGEVSIPTLGTRSGATPPPNLSVLVRKLTAGAGRRNRGRMYLPVCYLLETDVDNFGIIGSTPLGNMQSNMDGVYADQAGTSTSEGIVLFHSASPTTPTPVTSFSVQVLAGTQRERMRR